MITDYYSSYIWTRELYQDTKSCSIIKALLSVFHEFGVLEYLLSDGAANLTSQEIETFCQQFATQHIKTSAYHLASNGKVESAVKIVKTFIKNVYNSWEFSLAMMTYHDTPIGANLPMSAELMFQGCIQTDIPFEIIIDREGNSANELQHHQSRYLEEKVKIPAFAQNQPVYFQGQVTKKLFKGTIDKWIYLKDSYMYKQIDTDKVYKCNIKFIRSRAGKSEISPRSTRHISQPVTYQPKCDKPVIQTSTHPALEVHNTPARKAYTPKCTDVMVKPRKLFYDNTDQGQQGIRVHRELTKAIQTRYSHTVNPLAKLQDYVLKEETEELPNANIPAK